MSGLTYLNSFGHFVFLGIVIYQYKALAKHLKRIVEKENRLILPRAPLTRKSAHEAIKVILHYD